jgi:alpha-beta hydrolase superfamily lysophospholipase
MAAVFLLACFLLLNALAWRHARAMLSFTAGGDRTASVTTLSFGQKAKVLLCGVTMPRPVNTRAPQDLGLTSQTVRFTTDDGLKLEGWLITPAEPRGTVLLFHGYSASRTTLLEQARTFDKIGFAALLVDFRGGGGSDGSTTTLGYLEARDVAATVEHARRRQLPRPLVLYGQSMGAAAALRSISSHEVCPDAVILESVFDRLLITVRDRFEPMGVPSFPSAELLVFWGGVQQGFSGFDHNPLDYARACTCPALVLHGADDRHTKLASGRAVFQNLAGIKEMVEFAGAGHVSLLEADAGQWTATVQRFLSNVAVRTE